MPRALALTDVQLAVVRDVARHIPPSARSEYLETLAARLRNLAEPGDGAVHRAAVATAREVLARGGLAPWTSGGGEPEDG